MESSPKNFELDEDNFIKLFSLNQTAVAPKPIEMQRVSRALSLFVIKR